jgi:NAD-dependent dihydropyrimidine dehydrogenase PreA subunit
MKREIIKIDNEKCDGCGLCIPNCHEGALQIIDEKAVLISDLMCDGLGACIGHCPQDALTIEEREAEAYDEVMVMKEMIQKGKNVVVAHMKHLKDHQEHSFLKEGVQFLLNNKEKLDFNPVEVIQEVHGHGKRESLTGPAAVAPAAASVAGIAGAPAPVKMESGEGCGCMGSREMSFQPEGETVNESVEQPSSLRQWPVQLHLINPAAGYFQGADLLVAADCVAYAMGDFHSKHLRNKSLVIACPKLDSRQEVYQQKITALIDQSQVNTLTVMIMEVPCCGGLMQLVQDAVSQAQRKVPIKAIQVGVQGQVLAEEWV